MFGGFVEQMGRSIYTGIYEPAHGSADASGFRTDVLELVRELGITTIRYPGGNFVSGFRWEDSVGPVADRPKRLDLAWHSIETNEVGLHEFTGWLDQTGAELMLAINLGTRGLEEALDLLEYCNHPSGTHLSDHRAANGYAQPLGVRMWCLGNEMDGPWQLGHRSAEDYGKLAAQVAKGMHQIDPALELVLCGSSASFMPTFGEWERIVLTHAYDEVSHISCHAYYQEHDGDLSSFLGSAVDMDRQIEAVIATADQVRATLGKEKYIQISFDEWNVWYQSRNEAQGPARFGDDWPLAPRLLEDVYTVADAVVVGSLLISLLNHADRVSAASLAQLVNVIGPILTEPGGAAWRQTTFYPFALTSRWARGVTLLTILSCPTIQTRRHGAVDELSVAVTWDEASGEASVFIVNRNATDAVTFDVDVASLGPVEVVAQTLADADHYAANSREQQDRVVPSPLAADNRGRVVRLSLPPVSWSIVRLIPQSSTTATKEME